MSEPEGIPIRRTLVLATVIVAAIPSAASADVPIRVPASLLDGRVVPAPAIAPDATSTIEPEGADLTEPLFWDLVWPDDADPAVAGDDLDAECDEAVAAATCAPVEAGPVDEIPLDPPGSPDVPPAGAPAPAAAADGARLRPRFGAWVSGPAPRLRWARAPGARRYVVRVFLGSRRVASVWTPGPSVRVPPRRLERGRHYVWAVWPATGSRRHPRLGSMIGRSVFGVLPRPRIVFRSMGDGVEGEVRPRIPHGRIALLGIPGRGVVRVRIDRRSRIRLAVDARDVERLTAVLIDPGPRPPAGIRARG